MTAPLPDVEYLSKIGELAYKVSYLEWLLIGDLPRLSRHLEPGMTADKLIGKTTGGIATKLDRWTPMITDPGVQTYFQTGAGALRMAARIRNAVLHARPATHPDDGQMLNRKPDGENPFWVTPVLVEAGIRDVEGHIERVLDVRPSF